MVADQIAQLEASARERIETAADAEQLEAVRVEFLGRKGALTSVSKDMGKLSPEERAALGKALNAARQTLESSFEARKQAFESEALKKRLDSEWVDLTLPA